METAVKKIYESMFLFDSAQASDWDAVVKTVETILKRADAEVVSIRNWADRKLAYEINSKTRGTYALCFFKADGSSVRKIEKDVQLSEQVMRVLILSTEAREKKDIEKDMFGAQEEIEKPTATKEKPEDVTGQPEAPEADETTTIKEPETDGVELSVEPEAKDDVTTEQAESDGVELSVEPESQDDVTTEQAEPNEGEPPVQPAADDAIKSEQPETEQEPTEPDTKETSGW